MPHYVSFGIARFFSAGHLRTVLRPQRRVGVPLIEEVFEEYDVVRLQPAIKFLAGIVVNEICRRIVIGVFKIDAMFGIGIGLVDPVNKRLFIPDDEKITIEQG